VIGNDLSYSTPTRPQPPLTGASANTPPSAQPVAVIGESRPVTPRDRVDLSSTARLAFQRQGPPGSTTTAPGPPSGAGASAGANAELSDGEQKQVDALKKRDQEVRAHEQAHQRVGGQYASAPSYEYQQGPDGKQYAVGGEVQIDANPVPGDPDATIEKMRIVKAAALAPAEPSGQDRKVAAQADATAQQAQAEKADMQRAEREAIAKGEAPPDSDGGPQPMTPAAPDQAQGQPPDQTSDQAQNSASAPSQQAPGSAPAPGATPAPSELNQANAAYAAQQSAQAVAQITALIA